MNTVSTTIKIQNKHGIHARPSAYFVKIASQYKSSVIVEKNEFKVDGKGIMDLMTLEAGCGDTIKIVAKGEDAQQVIDALTVLINNKFGFEE